MAFILSDRIKETSTTSGTGAVALGSAYGGFQTFADAIGDGNKTYYGIEDGVNWEIGIGTYTLSSNSISRDVVLSSSTGSKLSLSGGVSTVFCTYPANRSFIMTQDGYASGVSPYYSGILFPDGTTQITSATGDISAPLTVKRTDAGDLFHFYVDNDNDRTVALNLENSSAPTWKIGLKDGPSNKTAAPTYGYVYGNNGSAGVYATSDSALIVNYSNGAWIKHRDSDLFNLSKSGGAKFLNAEAAVVPVKVRGANSQSAHLQIWENNSQSTLAYVDYAGVISGVKLKTASLEFRDGSIMSSAGEGMSSGDLVSFLTNDAGYITAHPTISTASGSTSFAGRTYIQNILFDQFGHVSGVSVGTETVADTNTTYTAGSGLTLDGTTFKIDTNSTVLESGRNVSLLTNDAGYTTYTGFELYLDGVDLSKTIRSSDFLNIDAGSNVTVSYLNTSNGSGHNVTINAVQKTTEEIQDVVGAMFSGNTETNITATYQDADGTIDLVSTDTTYTAGSGIVLNGTEINIPTATASTAGLVTLSNTVADNANVVATSKAVHDAGYLTAHPSVSQGSNINLDNSDGTVIQDIQITLDSNGHVTTSTAGTIDLDGRYFTESELTGGMLDSRYYTESELNTSGGGGQVHWNNVTNKPTIGDITAVVAGSGMSGGGTESSVTVNVDLQQLANETMTASDQMVFIDGDGSSKRTAVSTVATVVTGGILDDTNLTGNPTAPTQAASNNSTRLATTAYVTTAVSNLVDGAPGALNTLNELAAAINDSGNYAAGITSLLSEKAYTYNLSAASGDLDNRLHEVSGVGGQVLTASGYLYTDILSVSGIAGGGETNQNAFSIVAVDGQTNVAADAKTDTLTLAGGSNVTITTNGSDTVTIAATDTNTTYTAGSGISLNGTQFNVGISGNNILATNSPVNNYVPSYVNGEFTWVAQTSDTNTTYTAGSGLVLHGTEFNIPMTTTSASGLVILSNTISSDQTTALTPKAVNDDCYLTAHPNISAASSVDNGTRTYIQDITLDSNGHVTAIASATETVTDTNTTYTAGSGLVLHGTQFDSAISGYNLLAINNPENNYIPRFKSDYGKFEWVAAGAGEANQNAFSTIAVADEDNVAADSATDTLNLAAGSNVTITTTAASDTVTIASANDNTTYTAGSGLVLHGTQFNIPMTTTSASGLVILTNTISSNQTTALTPKAVNDAGYITASSSDTLTNKTIGATQLTGTIDSARLPDLAVSDFAASAIVTESEGIGSSDNDTSLPTSAAVKDYVDTQIATEDTIAELNDTNISSPAAGHLLIYDNTASVWDNATLTEGSNVTITESDGAITIAAADTNTMGAGFVLEDGDGTEVTITENKEVKFVEGTGIDINWTDTDNGTDGDPYDLTFTIDLEGTELKSTTNGNEAATKYLRADGDGTCSWQTISVTVDIDALSALGGTGLHQTQDHFMFSDNGTEKKITFSNLQDAIFADISGNATVAAGGALTIANDAITSALIADDAVVSAAIADDAVLTAHIADDAITSALIADDAIVSAAIADDAVLTAHIADDQITAALMADNSVDSDMYVDGSIGTAHIANDAVTYAKIENVTNATMLGNNSGSDGSVTEMTKANVLSFLNVADGATANAGDITSVVAGAGLTGGATTGDATINVVGGDGITANANDVAITAAQTTITSIYNSSLAIGYGASDANINFGTDNQITFDIDGTGQVVLKDGMLHPVTDSDVDLGKSDKYWKDAYIDTITTTGDVDVLGNIELGHASDTTIARASAGQITVEGTAVILAGAVTGITSITNTGLVIGRDADNDIDFATDNTIIFRAAATDQLTLVNGALTPSSNAGVDLGTDALEFKDGYFDGTLEADAITVNGTALDEFIADTVGAMVGSNTETGIGVTYDDSDNTLDFVVGTLNQDTSGTAAIATTVTVADESSDTTCFPLFVTAATGDLGPKSGSNLTFNSDTGLLTATSLGGTLTTAAQTNITSLGTLTTLTVDNVIINGNTIGHTDDTDLITLADGLVTVAGEISVTTLDIGGTNVSSTAAELNYNDTGAAVGTVVASKTVTVDANKDVSSFRNVTLTGELTAATLDISGNVDIDGTTNLDAVDIDGDVDITGELKVTGAIIPGAGINAQTDDASIDINCSEGNYYEVTLTANTTTTAINFTSVDTTFGQRIIVKFLQPADTSSGSAVLSAGAGFDDVTVNGGSALTVKWPGGTAPTLTTGNSAADVFGFIIRSASSVDGFIIGQDIKAPS